MNFIIIINITYLYYLFISIYLSIIALIIISIVISILLSSHISHYLYYHSNFNTYHYYPISMSHLLIIIDIYY